MQGISFPNGLTKRIKLVKIWHNLDHFDHCVLKKKKKKKKKKKFKIFFNFFFFFLITIHWKTIQSRVITWSPGIEIPKNPKKNFFRWFFFLNFFYYFLINSGHYNPNLVRWSLFITFSSHLDFEETNFHPCCSNSNPLGNGFCSKNSV